MPTEKGQVDQRTTTTGPPVRVELTQEEAERLASLAEMEETVQPEAEKLGLVVFGGPVRTQLGDKLRAALAEQDHPALSLGRLEELAERFERLQAHALKQEEAARQARADLEAAYPHLLTAFSERLLSDEAQAEAREVLVAAMEVFEDPIAAAQDPSTVAAMFRAALDSIFEEAPDA